MYTDELCQGSQSLCTVCVLHYVLMICKFHFMLWVGCREGGGGMGPADRWLLSVEADWLKHHSAVPESALWHSNQAAAHHYRALFHQRYPAGYTALPKHFTFVHAYTRWLTHQVFCASWLPVCTLNRAVTCCYKPCLQSLASLLPQTAPAPCSPSLALSPLLCLNYQESLACPKLAFQLYHTSSCTLKLCAYCTSTLWH